MTILLVRHGETEWNRQRRNQGRLDSPLTEHGRAQAAAIGALLAELPEAAGATIVASPLGRARHTAEIIRAKLPHARALLIDERLRELTLGAWDGLTYREIEAIEPGIFGREGPLWWFKAPGGESHASFSARLGEWLAEQRELDTNVAVAHGLVSRLLRGLYLGFPAADALTLPVPQNRIFRLSEGSVETLTIQLEPEPESAPADGRG